MTLSISFQDGSFLVNKVDEAKWTSASTSSFFHAWVLATDLMSSDSQYSGRCLQVALND